MRRFALLALPLLAAACGGRGGPDFGAVSDNYPAPHPPIGQMVNQGGVVLTQPVLTAITFPGDADAPLLEDFTARLGTSTYWMTVTTDYGIAPAVATTALRWSAPAPQSTTTAAMESWLSSILDGSHPEYPQPQPGSIYVIFYPPGTVVDDGAAGGVSCQDYYAFHSFVNVAGTNVAYALVPRCAGGFDLSDLDQATDSASHELVEAATDPYDPAGWLDTDPAGGGWDLLSGGGEVADLCQYEQHENVVLSDFPYVVQKSWSNKAAAASHDPCAPQIGVYFAAMPELPETVTVSDGSFDYTVKGVTIGAGKSKTITLDLFSDGPTEGDFWVRTLDNASYYGASELRATLDRDHGSNGQKVHVKITVERKGTIYPGAEVLYVFAEKDGTVYDQPIVVKTP